VLVICRFLRSSRGQALVEFALILPFLLMVLLGIAEFGRLLNAYLVLEHAAREGVRLGATGASDAEIIQRIEEVATTLDTARLQIEILPAEGSRARGEPVSVGLQYAFPFIVPLVESVVGGEVSLGTELSMRVE